MKAKMYPKAGLGKIRMPKRYAQGGNPSANEDMPPPKRSPREMAEWQEAIRTAPRNPRRPLTKEELKRQGLDMDKRYAEGGEISDTRKRFNQAFAEAREDGETEFEFDGKMYSTRREDEGDEYKEKMRKRKKPEVTEEVTVSGRREPLVNSPQLESARERMMSASSGQSRRGDAEKMMEARRKRDDETARGLAGAYFGPIAAAGTTGALGAAGNAARVVNTGGRSLSAAPARATDDLPGLTRRLIRGDRKVLKEAEEKRRRNAPIQELIREGKYKGHKAGGSIKAYAKGGRIDGIATKGKTRGRIF